MLRFYKSAFSWMGLQSMTIGLSRRNFTTTRLINADLVQDIYLRELKSYKSSPSKLGDLDGQIQKFTIPRAPSSPEDGDIAKDLKAYETQEVEVESAALEADSVQDQELFEAEEKNNNNAS